jgi:hypothetical protein
LSRRVPLDSLCPDATCAEHNATTSSRKSGRDMGELSYSENSVRARNASTSDDGPRDDAGFDDYN